MDSHLLVSALATDEKALCCSSLTVADSGALNAAAAQVQADTGAAAQAASGCKPWDASDDFDSHAAAPDEISCRRTPPLASI